MTGEVRSGPLRDLRVIEAGQLIAGPFCGQLLGDFGAEVIKIEPPRTGDPLRAWRRMNGDGPSLWWPIIARNKKSITLDLRQSAGQELARRLIGRADVLIENFRPGTMEKWNLGYDRLAAANPGLVMARMSGFGQTGPYCQQPGFGSIGEAMGGLRYVTGHPDRPHLCSQWSERRQQYDLSAGGRRDLARRRYEQCDASQQYPVDRRGLRHSCDHEQ